jgi:small subunit ribosomal protein S17
MEERELRKVVQGVVVSNKMKNTVVVNVVRKLRHPKYEKLVDKRKKYYAHTEKDLEVGQEVRIMSCRPISKTKRWRVI